MDRINGADFVDIGGGKRGFRSENPVAGVSGTEVTDVFLNDLQEELCNAIVGMGIPLDATKRDQLLTALRRAARILPVNIPIDGFQAAPPASPLEGSQYLVRGSATGAWVGRAGQIARYLDGAWAFETPRAGRVVTQWANSRVYYWEYDGTTWLEVRRPATSNLDNLEMTFLPTNGHDLNALVTPGIYMMGTNAGAGAGNGYPLNRSGFVFVDTASTTNHVFQTYRTLFNSGTRAEYLRHSPDNGATWSDWREYIFADSPTITALTNRVSNIPVQGVQNAPPNTTYEGVQYLVGPNPSGAWVGKAHQIARFNGDAWNFEVPRPGRVVTWWNGGRVRTYEFTDLNVWTEARNRATANLDNLEITILPSNGHNLNALVTPGVYVMGSNGGASAGTGYPLNRSGFVFVETGPATTAVFQTYRTLFNSGTSAEYLRYSSDNGATWSDWREYVFADFPRVQGSIEIWTENGFKTWFGSNGNMKIGDEPWTTIRPPEGTQALLTAGSNTEQRTWTAAMLAQAIEARITARHTQSFGETGWSRMPNGLILQWGKAEGAGVKTITFPVAFPTMACAIVGTDTTVPTSQAGGASLFYVGGNYTRTGFECATTTNVSSTNNDAATWIAIGF